MSDALGRRNEDVLVTVTGASGFIATHCILKLLQQGYRVRGTLRSAGRRQEIEEALCKYVDLEGRLSFALTDLERDEGWDEAMKGATYLLHVASPVAEREPKDERELIEPARDGCRRALSAAIRAGVKRTVLTSSVAAVYIGLDRTRPEPFNESDWSDTQRAIGAYAKSKTLAEKTAWTLVESQPAGRAMELTTINPTYVLGPPLIRDSSPSTEIVGKLMRREIPGCPDLRFNLVDVRDIAEAHIVAMIAPEAVNRRFIMGSDGVPLIEIARILKRSFGNRGYRVPAHRVPKLMVRIVALFDKTVRMVVKDVGRTTRINTEPARSILGWSPRPLEKMVVDTGEALIAQKLV